MSEPKLTIYTPDSPLIHPGRMLIGMCRDLCGARELAWRLAVRDLSSQYRQAFLGFLWMLIIPASHAAVWVFLNANRVVTIDVTLLPYAVYVVSGTLLWAIFSESVQAPLHGVMAAQNMLTRVNFPREAIVLSGIYQVLFNAMIKLGIMLFALIYFRINPDWHVTLVPLGMVSLILIGTTIGVLLTPLGLLYTDIGKGVPLLMQFLMYLTPVVFAMPSTGLAEKVFTFNPLTPIIISTRNWLAGTTTEWLGAFLLVNAISLLLLIAVWVTYRLAMPILIERMSA